MFAQWRNDIWRRARGWDDSSGTWHYVGAGALAASLLGAAVIAGGGLTLHDRNAARVMDAQLVPSPHASHLGWREPDVTTTTVSPPSTLVAIRQQPKPQAATPQPASPVDDAFWRRLANCESPNGANGGFNGYFQLAGSTAKTVGYHGGSYEEQLAAAKRWLAIIGVAKAGTRAGWPICWWVAMRG